MPISRGFLLLCGLQRQVVRENLSLRSITISVIAIGDFPRGIKRRVQSEERVFSEQKRSGISVQADGTLCRRLQRWPCRFPNDRRSQKPLVGIFTPTHRM